MGCNRWILALSEQIERPKQSHAWWSWVWCSKRKAEHCPLPFQLYAIGTLHSHTPTQAPIASAAVFQEKCQDTQKKESGVRAETCCWYAQWSRNTGGSKEYWLGKNHQKRVVHTALLWEVAGGCGSCSLSRGSPSAITAKDPTATCLAVLTTVCQSPTVREAWCSVKINPTI